ncbi:hypothetical protein [Paenibacillus sp. NPDC058177]|uniref:hypothetical protein n=1 Tax=Paenibacillus sp. NPDC058177 TaxID=3346369 RepID=UPI0036DB9D10
MNQRMSEVDRNRLLHCEALYKASADQQVEADIKALFDSEAAAWSEVERLSSALEEAQQTLNNLRSERDGLKEHRSELVISNTELQGRLLQAQQTIAQARHIVEVPPAVFGEGFDWEFHYKSRRRTLLKLLGDKDGGDRA